MRRLQSWLPRCKAISLTRLCPLTPNELVIAYSSGGATRGVVVGIAVGATMSLFADLRPQSLLYIVFYVISSAYMLAMLGIIGGIWADRQDHMTVVNGFIITPLSFLSGILLTLIDCQKHSRQLHYSIHFFTRLMDCAQALPAKQTVHYSQVPSC